MDPSENDVTPAASMSNDDDFGSEDGTEDTATQLAIAMQTFDSYFCTFVCHDIFASFRNNPRL